MVVYASAIQYSRPPATTMYGFESKVRKGAAAASRALMLFRMITRLWGVIAEVVRKRMSPKRTAKASRFRNEPMGMPPLPV